MEARICHDVLQRTGGRALGFAGAVTSPETLQYFNVYGTFVDTLYTLLAV